MMRKFNLLFLLLILAANDALADRCDECRHNGKNTCSFRCDTFTDTIEYDSCVDDCIKTGCEKACKSNSVVVATPPPDPRTVTSPLGRPAADCNTCLKTQEASGCGGQCERPSPRYVQCSRRCAKRACAALCNLPDATEEKPFDPADKYSCQKCQDDAEPGCHSKENCDPESPSLNACVFRCVQERCAENCN